MIFYEWGFLLILESDKKFLQRFLEKGNEEGGIRSDLRSLKPQNFASIPLNLSRKGKNQQAMYL